MKTVNQIVVMGYGKRQGKSMWDLAARIFSVQRYQVTLDQLDFAMHQIEFTSIYRAISAATQTNLRQSLPKIDDYMLDSMVQHVVNIDFPKLEELAAHYLGSHEHE